MKSLTYLLVLYSIGYCGAMLAAVIPDSRPRDVRELRCLLAACSVWPYFARLGVAEMVGRLRGGRA